MQILEDADACVDETLERVGSRVVLGLPLGLGKPVTLADAFYRRAESDPGVELTILTALTLSPPSWSSDLEGRLVEPIVDRVFGDYRTPAYARAAARGELPENVRVIEFFFAPGSRLGDALAQRRHASIDYTHVVRELLDRGINVVAQLVAPPDANGRYSLSCNPDLAPDLVPRLRDRGEPHVIIGQTHPELPHMKGDAEVDPSFFDVVLEAPSEEGRLFGLPNEAVSTVDYAIGAHASGLVRDGGTLQIGIGSLGDAVVHMLCMRHRSPSRHGELLEALATDRGLVDRLGGGGPFEQGLYANSEMLVDGFLHLYREGILRRRAFDDPETQRAVNEGTLDPAEVPGGAVAHASFFLGPRDFYEGLRSLSEEERALFRMTRVNWVNALYGDEELKRLQRRDARFLNTCLQATLLGEAASDTLEDGRVISGVGGQYNFVAMGHALEDGRSILMLRSVRENKGQLRSNILSSHGHATIPRHLRDLVVTEYGVADLRGRTDEECVQAMLAVADSRVQPELLEEAKRAGKLAPDYEIPERHRRNTPERLEEALAPHRSELPEYPLGSDLSPVEQDLARALQRLDRWRKERKAPIRGGDLRTALVAPEAAKPYLARMGLDAPSGLEERTMRRVLLHALSAEGVI